MHRNNKIHVQPKMRIKTPPIAFDPSLLLQPTEELLKNPLSPIRYRENKNNSTFTHLIDMSKDGYIYPVLPAPYVYVPDNKMNPKGNHHIEILIPKILTKYEPQSIRPLNFNVVEYISQPKEVISIKNPVVIVPSNVQVPIPVPGPVPVLVSNPAPGPGNVIRPFSAIAPGPVKSNPPEK